MGYLPPTTIATTLRRIQRGDLILPAIQREYVWKPAQVIGLFDSVMRGYPIGGLLSWKVEPDTVKKFRFYGFIKDYSGFNNRHNPVLDLAPGQAVTAMLDGQQRLTSLNIGLRGSYAYRVRGGWRSKPDAYPIRRLYLNVLGEAEDNEAGLRYDFRFLTNAQVASTPAQESKYWYPVHRVFEAEDLGRLWGLAGSAGLGNDQTAIELLSRLWQVLHANQSLHFYEEDDQDVERVLDIFIRVNSAGTVLSYSDLLLSIATAQWKERDARDAIHGLVDTLNRTGQGFGFSQDVVLKSGLVLAGINDIAFKVKNFTAANMATLDESWDNISESLKTAVGLLSDFGLSDPTLSADSVLIPVAYYVHRRGLTQKYRESASEASDRASLRSWVLRSLIMPGIWGSGLDSLLRDLRQVILDHGARSFPAVEVEKRMAARGKSLVLGEEQISDILELSYGSPRTFAVLAVLFPNVDTRNIHHVDHIFPQSLLRTSKLRQLGLDSGTIDDLQSKRDKLPNLELLEGVVNITKSDSLPTQWAQHVFHTSEQQQAYLDRNHIPWLPASPEEFTPFFEERRTRLAQLIAATLSASLAVPQATEDATYADQADSKTITSIETDMAESAFNDL